MRFTSVLDVVVSASAAEVVHIRNRGSGDGKRKLDMFSRPSPSSATGFRRPAPFTARPASSGFQGAGRGTSPDYNRTCFNCGGRGYQMREFRRPGGGAYSPSFQRPRGNFGRGTSFPRRPQLPYRPPF